MSGKFATLPDPVGKCPLCTINLYPQAEGPPKPVIFPCGIFREAEGRCQWETEIEQKALNEVKAFEKVAGLLGTMHTND